MTAPQPHDSPRPASRRTPSAARAERRLATLARKWAYLVSGTAYLPHTPAEVEHELTLLVHRLFGAVHADPVGSAEAAAAGARLVELRCVGPDSLRCSIEVLGKALLHEPELRYAAQLAERVVLVLGSLSAGYNEALREDIQKRQEGLGRALAKVELDTRHRFALTQAQFEEVFTGSSSGVALTDLDGTFLRVNATLARILDRAPAEITGRTLAGLVHSEDAVTLAEGLTQLLEGKLRHLRLRLRFVAQDGEPMWTTFVAAIAPDAHGVARQLVALVDDDTEISLLQRRLSHQALYDALTGLPNRQFFGTRLENALRHADPDTGVTLYHLDLDGFSLVTDGLGHEHGDRLLKSVARKLESVVEEETALVARLGGDEFGVLVENTAETPGVVTTVRQIARELAEPVYLDGTHGVAVSASIGVVHRPPRDIASGELLRAADMTLRRAQSGGRGQWALFDPELDHRDRHDFGLAASMAGAWETGEIEVVYRPLVHLADEEPVGAEARLQWNHPREGTLDHDTCVRLAKNTGLILSLGKWLLETACEQLAGTRLPLSVGLTPHQASDPDLVGDVRRILETTGLDPARLRTGFPAASLLAPGGDAMDNLAVLAEIGVESEIQEFTGTGDVACLADPPVRTVRVAAHLVRRQQEDHGPLFTRAVNALVELANLAGARVVVPGLETHTQATWWREAGADLGLGPLFPAPPAWP